MTALIPISPSPLDTFSDHIAARRDAILRLWWKLSSSDPQQTTKHSLTRAQFNDHVPQVLDAFERTLRARPGGREAKRAENATKQEEIKHGLHRWQQGYRLQELLLDWGHLERALSTELEAYTLAHPEFGVEALLEASRQIATLVNDSMCQSAAQYERMQQAEATAHIGELRSALEKVNAIERHRAAMIHQAVHDLNSNVFSVSVAVQGLGTGGVAEAERIQFTSLLKQGVHEVSVMLGELMDLARLEAGQEEREIAPLDVAALIVELVRVNQPVAESRGLFLKSEGSSSLQVQGDPAKVRRLLQNLVLNALKYTHRGGVIVSWGEEKVNWWLTVADTGPGLSAGPSSPLVEGLIEATANAREADENTELAGGKASNVLTPESGRDRDDAADTPASESGEGVGLSIVKRLCELLDASMEIATSPETGTTFRIMFPREYRAATDPASQG
jgi:signal transduction histidine kinase